MPKRQINLFVSLTASCLFCLGLGCGSQPPRAETTDPSEKPTAKNTTPRSTDPPPVPATAPVEAHGPLAQPAKPSVAKPSVAKPAENEPPAESQAQSSTQSTAPDTNAQTPEATDNEAEQQTIQIPDSWVRLSKQHEIWIDMKAKKVMIAGQICLQQGALEVFACPRQTKEHESVVSANASALELHTCLIAIGADPGKPVQWTPQYIPATGPKINIDVVWSKDGKETTRNAKEMIRNFETKKELNKDWVFCGSQFYVNPENGDKIYYGNSGEMICVSNFSTASLDLPVESSGSNEMLLFEANTEKIPERGTKVYLVLSKIDEANTK